MATSSMITGIAARGPITAAARCQVFGMYMAYTKISIIHGIDGLSVGLSSPLRRVFGESLPALDGALVVESGSFSNASNGE